MIWFETAHERAACLEDAFQPLLKPGDLQHLVLQAFVFVAKLLGRARAMMVASGPTVSPSQNPGVYLGAVIGALARAKRDKSCTNGSWPP